MTDGIGRIFGGNSYGVGGYVPQRHDAKEEETANQPVVQPELEQHVDPEKVMELLANNNLFVQPKASTPVELDPEVENRVIDAMERFEEVYAIIEDEVGPELAPLVADEYMNRQLGLV